MKAPAIIPMAISAMAALAKAVSCAVVDPPWRLVGFLVIFRSS
jgi:hypothetical protein